MAKQLVATQTFRANVDGFDELFTEGVTIVDADSVIARSNPERFKPYREARPEVEEATAEPGVKRGEKR